MIKQWLPWFRRDWHLVADAKRVLRFMSVQMNIIGASVIGFEVYAGWPAWSILATLAAWVALAALGAVIAQPELAE